MVLVNDVFFAGKKVSKPSEGRLDWVDAARGIAIMFVVFGHAWRGLYSANILQDEALFIRVDQFIYLFHMPVFFLLSGLFLPNYLNIGRFTSAIFRQALRLLYPLFLWTYLFQFIRYHAGDAANSVTTLADVFAFPLPPVDHMWFLWTLFCIQIPMTAFLFLVPEYRLRPSFVTCIFALSLIWFVVMPLPTALFDLFFNAFYFAPFFALGWVLATRQPIDQPGATQTAICVIIFAGVGYYFEPDATITFIDVIASLAMTISFVVIVMALQAVFHQTSVLRLLRTLGHVSLAIFLAHTVFSAAVRFALIKADVLSFPWHIAAGTIVGLLGPYLMHRVASRTGTLRVLGF